MDDTPNPVTVIAAWLASQAREIQEHLCLFLRAYDGEGVPDVGEDIVGAYLQALREAPRGLADVGRAFKLRAILDFELGKKATPWDWSLHRKLLNRADASSEMKETMERMIREGPLRERRWRQVHREWLRTREALTDEKIDAFIKAVFGPTTH